MSPLTGPQKRATAGCAVILLGTLLGMPATAAAHSEGTFGRSGRQISICTECHGGGSVPEVAFEAPQGTQMVAGAIATFRFRITSAAPKTQTHAGFDVAPSRGTIRVVDPDGTRLFGIGIPDISHSKPRGNDADGVAIFEFTWQAPMTPGTYTLFGAGNSVNFDELLSGDNAAATTLEIDVVAAATLTPTTTPTAEATPTTTEIEGACTGDCDGSGTVTVDEVVCGVNIALGDRPVDDCPAFDRDGDGVVTVDEIVEAIGNALNGCI